MSCAKHKIYLTNCLECSHTVIKDQGRLVNNLYDKVEMLIEKFPWLDAELRKLEEE